MKTIHALKSAAAAAHRQLAQAGFGLAVLLATTAARAVNDLPGGPAVNQIDLHPPATRIAVEQQWLHNFMMILCTLIFIGVFGVMFYSILKHRKSKGAKPANFHESTTVEIAWFANRSRIACSVHAWHGPRDPSFPNSGPQPLRE